MKIGFTYDFKDDYINAGWTKEEAAEFDSIETIEGIEKTLSGLNFSVDKIGNVKNLINRLTKGEMWDFVFNICEGTKGFGREAIVPSILEEYRIPYSFSDPLVLSVTLHKGMTKKIIRSYGILTSDYRLIKRKKDLNNVRLPYPLFLKPVAEGTGKGISEQSKVNSSEELKKVGTYLLEKFKQPVLVEKFLSGREFTVGILGTGDDAKIIGVMEVLFKNDSDTNIYTFRNKAYYQDYVNYKLIGGTLKDICSDLALRSWKALDCRDAGRVDIRLDANGSPYFLEVNPLAGLNYLHSDLPILSYKAGWSYEQLIKEILTSAFKRYELKFPV